MLLNPHRFGSSPPPSDPYWSNVSCLLHMNGADTSTTITDQKGGSWAASSGAQIRTDISKLGGAALLLDGTDDKVTGPTDSAFTFASGDFAIEFWFYCGADLGGSSVQKVFASKWDGGGGYEWILDYYQGFLRGIINNTSNATFVAQAATTFTAGNWYHIAWTRSGATTYLFIDGAVALSQGSFGHNMQTSSTPVIIGHKFDGTSSNFLNGRIDEFRITKGIARYTTAFSPSIFEFPDS